MAPTISLSKTIFLRSEMGTALGLLVSPLTDTPEWRKRVSTILAYWKEHIFDRDEDITPVMYCAALMPGVWQKATYEEMHA